MPTETGLFLGLALRAGSLSCPFERFTFPTASLLHSNDALRCRTIQPAFHRLRLCCPRLRSRLTLGRKTVPRNPQAFGVSGSHRHLATHSGILSCVRSTGPCSPASVPTQCSPTMAPFACLLARKPATRGRPSAASVRCLSLVTLSAPLHSTSELLRTLSMMAASKPTSWLFGHSDYLSH
jgi:hypothetical protein